MTGEGLDPYNVHALFVNMDNMWMERLRNYDCLVLTGGHQIPKPMVLKWSLSSVYLKVILRSKSFQNQRLSVWIYIPESGGGAHY